MTGPQLARGLLLGSHHIDCFADQASISSLTKNLNFVRASYPLSPGPSQTKPIKYPSLALIHPTSRIVIVPRPTVLLLSLLLHQQCLRRTYHSFPTLIHGPTLPHDWSYRSTSLHSHPISTHLCPHHPSTLAVSHFTLYPSLRRLPTAFRNQTLMI